ncbi:MAG: enoyl-CoA hydratase-related protein [Clostridiales bacterium]|nr:enoyl-CoA hydratase-related protein [Clostridiales bacterium]
MYENILLDVSDKIATITLNRPEVGNAFAKESYLEIREALQVCEDDRKVGAIVITGAGKHFSSGGDIKRFKGLIESQTFLTEEGIQNAANMALAIKCCKKPVIAMINGAAAGAGCSLALACDFRVMTPKSKLIMAFIKLGLSGDTCGLYLLHKIVGTARAVEMMMLGNPVGGEQALAYGLTTCLFTEEEFKEKTYEFAAGLAHSPTIALGYQKALIKEYFYSDMETYLQQESVYMAKCSRTGDFARAVDAFLEKRQVEFQGD